MRRGLPLAAGLPRGMPMLPKAVLYYGKDEPLPEQVRWRAGPLRLVYEAGDMR